MSISPTTVRILSGNAEILAALPELMEQAGEWGQKAELSELPYYMSTPMVPARKPILVLVTEANSTPSKIVGAVLVFAYAQLVFSERLLTNSDRLGRIGVFGPADKRAMIAAVAARGLMERGAALVRLSFKVEDPGPGNAVTLASSRLAIAANFPESGRRMVCHLMRRERAYDLALSPSLDETLVALGKRTRRNIRAALRNCAPESGFIFEAVAAPSAADFLRLNRACTHPVPDRVARWRLASVQNGRSSLAGLRTREGKWIAFAGYRYSGSTAVVYWQMNGREYAHLSLSIVMRARLMELFGNEGISKLYFDGGTLHVMSDKFRRVPIYFLSVRRNARWLWALEWLMTNWFPRRAFTRSLFGGRRTH